MGISQKDIKVTAPAQAYAGNAHVNDIFRSVYNRSISDMYSSNPDRGILIYQNDQGNVGIRIYSQLTICMFVQFANNTDMIALLAAVQLYAGFANNGIETIRGYFHAVGGNNNAMMRAFRRLNRALKKQPRPESMTKQLYRGVVLGRAIHGLFNADGGPKGGNQFVPYANMQNAEPSQQAMTNVTQFAANIVATFPAE